MQEGTACDKPKSKCLTCGQLGCCHYHTDSGIITCDTWVLGHNLYVNVQEDIVKLRANNKEAKNIIRHLLDELTPFIGSFNSEWVDKAEQFLNGGV